jgi:hypothetical protein
MAGRVSGSPGACGPGLARAEPDSLSEAKEAAESRRSAIGDGITVVGADLRVRPAAGHGVTDMETPSLTRNASACKRADPQVRPDPRTIWAGVTPPVRSP